MCDENKETCEAVSQLLDFISGKVPISFESTEESKEGADTADIISFVSPEMRTMDHILSLIRAVIARNIQGNKNSLSVVVAHIVVILTDLAGLVRGCHPFAEDENSQCQFQTLQQSSVAIIDKLMDPVILAEELKCIAVREAYGYRARTVLISFEDSDVEAVWRWEVNSVNYFSKKSPTNYSRNQNCSWSLWKMHSSHG